MTKNIVVLIGLLGLLTAACAKKGVVKPEEPVVTPPIGTEEVIKTEPEIRYEDWQSAPSLETVYFDYDKFELIESARAALKKNAEYLKAHAEFSILLEGHADERGTTEYNLALGQRRSAAVRDYCGKLGIALSRMGTISYGEEKPVNPGHTEAAWSQNRRVETKIRSSK